MAPRGWKRAAIVSAKFILTTPFRSTKSQPTVCPKMSNVKSSSSKSNNLAPIKGPSSEIVKAMENTLEGLIQHLYMNYGGTRM